MDGRALLFLMSRYPLTSQSLADHNDRGHTQKGIVKLGCK